MRKTLILGLITTLCLAFLWGCREPSASSPMVSIGNNLISDASVVVVPDIRWKKADERGWMFQNRATLVCWIRQADQIPLVIRLRAEGPTAEHHFRFEWDGQPVAEQQVEVKDGVVSIRLPADQLSSGHHELQLHRDYKRDRVRVRQRLQNVFSEVWYRHGEAREILTRHSLKRLQLLTEFLQNGVIGTGRERHAGLLFVGQAEHRLELPPEASGTFVVEPRNFSEQRAVFRLADQSLELEPGEHGRLALDIASPAESLKLNVAGDPSGYFLWGMPRLESRPAPKELPPIILITLDTTRRDALGPYQDQSDLTRPGLTPTLDSMARSATVFERAFSTSPWTLPSHASIMTGLYPTKHRAGVSRRSLTGFPTLAELLRQRGYFTAGISSGDLSASRFGLARGFHLYRDPDNFETPGGNTAGYVDDVLDTYGHLPLFLFVNYFDAHALYQAPAPWKEKLNVPTLREKLRGQKAWDDLFAGEMRGWRRFVEGEVAATPEGLEYLRAAYLAEVAYLDHLLGRLMSKLRKLDLYDRALIVITADHGELLGEGGYFSHGARLDPELVEIPMIIKWPGQEQARRSRRLTSLIDLFPTVLEAAGAAAPPNDGFLLESRSSDVSPHSLIFLEEHESIVHPLPKGIKIARHLFGVQRPGFRQVVWDKGQDCARYADRSWRSEACTTDVADVLAAIQSQLGLVEVEELDPGVADEVRESLEALGYM